MATGKSLVRANPEKRQGTVWETSIASHWDFPKLGIRLQMKF